MSTADYIRSLRRRRAALLFAAVTTVVVVAALYFAGRRVGEIQPPFSGPGTATDAGTTMIAEGYDHTVTEGDQPLFRVRGGKIVQSREGGVELMDVALTLFRPHGEEYELKGQRALYDPQNRAARVEGNAVLAGPRGMRLETEALDLAPGGRRLSSEKGVVLALDGGYEGRAQSLRADLRDESFVLSGGVSIQGKAGDAKPLVLRAQRVLVERATGILHAEGGAQLRHRRDSISAGRLAAELTPEGEIGFVRARFGVEGHFRAAGTEADRVRFKAEAITLLLERGEASSLELQGWEQAPAHVESIAAGGAVLAMESPYMTARFVGGALASAEVLEGASFVETAAGGAEPLRKATSRRGQIVFEEGRAVAMSLASKVVLEEGKNRVFADQGIMDLRGKRATFEGQPVVATTERGELRSPRLTFQEASRIVLASGGVQCTLNPQGAALLARSGLASGSGPLRVDSAEASFQDGPRTAVFLGQVRAWRGSDVLVADQLRLDDATSTLTASGAVKTMWQAPGDPTAQGPAAEPVEIAADSLVYGAGKLTYQGTVIATQGARRLRCDEATIEVGEDKKVRRIVGRGRASLEEDSGRRKVTGDSLDYDLVEKRVTLRGAPVIVVDPVRGRAEGRLVVYDVATGAMRLSASAEPPAGAPDR